MSYTWPIDIAPTAQTISFDSFETTHTAINKTAQIDTDVSNLHEFKFEFPRLLPEQRLTVMGLLAQAMRDEFVVPVYQAGINTAPTMATTLSSIATGNTLAAVGVDIAYSLKVAQYISVIDGNTGRRYGYTLAAASASGSTARAFTIAGNARMPHPIGSVVEIKDPKVQGMIKVEDRAISMGAGFLSQLSFKIREAE